MANEPRGRASLSPYIAGLLGRCPRCDRGRLFAGFLTIAPKCGACDLDLAFADAGDGPAVFVSLVAGFLVLGAALAVETAFEPPMWIYPIVFLPLALIVCLGLLRPFKGFLIAAQYVNRAEQGRLERP